MISISLCVVAGFKKIFRAGFDRLHARWNVAVAGHEDSRHHAPQLSRAILQLWSAHTGHEHIE